MQQESFARNVLMKIALEQNKPVALVEPYIQALEENWLDTRDALLQMGDKDFEDLKIPKRIAQLIKENCSKPTIEVSPLEILIQQLSVQTGDKAIFEKSVSTIAKILSTVIENPLSPQYQSISLGSKTLQNYIMKYPAALKILTNLGWRVEGEFLKTNYSMNQEWANAVNMLNSVAPAPVQGFNPYQPSISSVMGVTNSDVARKEGYDVQSFGDKLEELKQKRYEIMSTPIKDRELKIFIGRSNQSIHEIQQQLQDQGDYDEIQPNKDKAYLDYIKQIAQSLEEQQFASRRKKEFEALLKKPVFGETLIRVKFPADTVLEAKFSPLETLQRLDELVKSVLQNPSINYYLYTSPPVQKMGKQHMETTFEDLNSVPNGIFYFGCEIQTQVLSKEVLARATRLG